MIFPDQICYDAGTPAGDRMTFSLQHRSVVRARRSITVTASPASRGRNHDNQPAGSPVTQGARCLACESNTGVFHCPPTLPAGCNPLTRGGLARR